MDERRACILVIDDAPEFREFVSVLLGGEGYRVAAAASAAEARAHIAAERPHLVMCDARHGVLPPFAVFEQLRSDPATRGIPLLLCTGAVAEVEQHAHELARAGVEVLLKPFDIDDLLARVARLCGSPSR